MTDFGTGETVAPSMTARAVRQRLLKPAGGVDSAEVEIINAPARRRIRIDHAIEADRVKRAAKLKAEFDAMLLKFEEQKEAREILELSTGSEPPLIPKIPTVNAIIAAVSDFYKINLVDMLSQRRTAQYVRARHIAMFIAREKTARSLPEIARRMGGRDHTTVLHGVSAVRGRLGSEPGLAAEIDQLYSILGVASPCVDRLRGEGSE